MADRVDLPARPSEPVRLAWCRWLEAHGIDPAHVPCGSWIERRDGERQIVHEAYERDADGRIRIARSGDEAARTVRVVQLEAAPLPWPQMPRPTYSTYPWSGDSCTLCGHLRDDHDDGRYCRPATEESRGR